MLEPRQRYDPVNVGRFHLLKRLGRGGFGTVFAAHDHRQPSELVAVKVLDRTVIEEHDFVERFAREIAAIGRVESRYVPPLIEAGPEDDPPWFAAHLVPGLSLDEIVKDCKRMPVAATWRIGWEIAEALAAFRRNGVIHRDLTPKNVLLVPSGSRIIDFGLVHLAEFPRLESSRFAAGTFNYMAPEQVDALSEAGPEADVFMLGGTLLFAVTGHPPHRSSNRADLLERARRGRPDMSGLPAEMRGTVAACLVRDPARRPALNRLQRDLGRRADLERSFASLLPDRALEMIGRFQRQLADLPATCEQGRAPSGSAAGRDRSGPEQTRIADASEPERTRLAESGGQTSTPARSGSSPAPTRILTSAQDVASVAGAVTDPGLPKEPQATPIRWEHHVGTWLPAAVGIADGVAVAVGLDGTLVGLDAGTGMRRWRTVVDAALSSAAVRLPGTAGEQLCFGDDAGRVHAVRVRSGTVRTLWQSRGAIQGPPAVGRGRIYAVSVDGGLYAIDPRTSEARLLFRPSGTSIGAPVVRGSAIFVPTSDGDVLAVDAVTGETRWRVPTEGQVCAAPLPAGDRVYIAATDGWLREIGPDGNQRAAVDLKAPVHVAPVHDRDRLYVGSCDGVLRAFDLPDEFRSDLKERWSCPLEDEVRGLAVARGRVYAAAGEAILGINAVTGESRPVCRMGSVIAAPPVPRGSELYITGLGGQVCCVSLS